MRNLNPKMKFIKLKKNDKKAGFTLIELVAVLAIIAVLSATFVPKFSNYITEAKKVAVLNEAKSVVTAYESVSYKINTTEADTTVLMLQNSGMPLKDITITKLPDNLKVSQCKQLLDPTTVFEVSSKGVLTSIAGSNVNVSNGSGDAGNE